MRLLYNFGLAEDGRFNYWLMRKQSAVNERREQD